MSTGGNAPPRRDAIERTLDLYYDGELRGLSKWRFERLLRRNPGLRRELETRSELSTLLREAVPETTGPDLWSGIAHGIAAADRNESPASASGGWARGWLSPLRIAPVLAGSAAAMLFFLLPAPQGDQAHQGVVRSIVARGRPVIVLDDSKEATIIWVMEDEKEGKTRGSDVART